MTQPSPALLPIPPPSEPPAPRGRSLDLLGEVRRAQKRSLWVQGCAWGATAFILAAFAGLFLGPISLLASRLFVALAPLLFFGLLFGFGLFLSHRRFADDARTALLLAERVPDLNYDLLAAVELSRALGRRHDFSPGLARAFLRDVDARAADASAASLIDTRPLRRASVAFFTALLFSLVLWAFQGERLKQGFTLAFSAPAAEPPGKREPITGDIELTYRYPAYTGRDPLTISGSAGDIAALAGTQVLFKTRADRDVEEAALVLSGQRLPLVVHGRDLEGSFILSAPGQYYVAFLDGPTVLVEGNEHSVTVEADQAPQVRLTAPADGLELDPGAQRALLKFEASDDYGLSSLDVVYRVSGGDEARTALRLDDGRTTRSSFEWDLSPLKLRPGQEVHYFVEAKDNDAVNGPKKGVSATLMLKVYSQSEHRRQALAKAEALWERLVLHLADRMEGADRQSPTPPQVAAGEGTQVDRRARQWAEDAAQLSRELDEEKDAPLALGAALWNISAELKKDTVAASSQRTMLVRLSLNAAAKAGVRLADGPNGSFVKELGRRLAESVAKDISHSENNVLFLESLLDRHKLEALRALAQELKEERQALSGLLEDFAKTKDPKTQESLLQQMEALRSRMEELRERMAELSKGIRDEFMNREALEEMMSEKDLDSKLEDIEKLVRAGDVEEAIKKMQELAMQMDELLESLDDAQEKSDEQADPELAQMLADFQQTLGQTVDTQKALAEKAKALRDRYREQDKRRIQQRGLQLRNELLQALKTLDDSYQRVDPEQTQQSYFSLKELAQRARQDIAHAREALESGDYDLTQEVATHLEETALQLAENAAQRERLEELYQGPPPTIARRETQEIAQRLQKNHRTAQEVAQKLRGLFPPPGSQMSSLDQQSMQQLAQQQRQLQREGQRLQQQMGAINEKAPIFDEDARGMAEQAQRRMESASERLAGRDPGQSFGEQQGAIGALQGLERALEQAGNSKGGKGLPLPLRNRRGGPGGRQEKVEIPEEDPNLAPREFRKDVMDAMKQGAPERYRDQNKRYYEELVK